MPDETEYDKDDESFFTYLVNTPRTIIPASFLAGGAVATALALGFHSQEVDSLEQRLTNQREKVVQKEDQLEKESSRLNNCLGKKTTLADSVYRLRESNKVLENKLDEYKGRNSELGDSLAFVKDKKEDLEEKYVRLEDNYESNLEVLSEYKEKVEQMNMRSQIWNELNKEDPSDTRLLGLTNAALARISDKVRLELRDDGLEGVLSAMYHTVIGDFYDKSHEDRFVDEVKSHYSELGNGIEEGQTVIYEPITKYE